MEYITTQSSIHTSISRSCTDGGANYIYSDDLCSTATPRVLFVKEMRDNTCQLVVDNEVLANPNIEEDSLQNDHFRENLRVEIVQINNSNNLLNSCSVLKSNILYDSNVEEERLSSTDFDIESLDASNRTTNSRGSSRIKTDFIQIDIEFPCNSDCQNSSHQIQSLPSNSSRTDSNSQTLSVLPRGEELLSEDCAPPTYRSLIELILEDSPPSYEAVTGKKVAYDEINMEHMTKQAASDYMASLGGTGRISSRSKCCLLFALLTMMMVCVGMVIVGIMECKSGHSCKW